MTEHEPAGDEPVAVVEEPGLTPDDEPEGVVSDAVAAEQQEPEAGTTDEGNGENAGEGSEQPSTAVEPDAEVAEDPAPTAEADQQQ